MFIVTDEVLEHLICSQCKKYLSVKPVKVYPNRGVKCGRCSRSSDAGVLSLFGILADEALFPCVNRFDSCNQLLFYSDVMEHEKTCVGKDHECPTCITPFHGTGYEIFMHFKEQHKDRLLLGTSEFVLDIDNEQYKTYLYKKNDLLFYINASYYKNDKEVILSISYLGTKQDAIKITQMFRLLSVDGKVIDKTVKNTLISGKNSNYFKIALDKNKVPKNVLICEFELCTEEMRNVLILPRTLYKSGVKLKKENKKSNVSSFTFPSFIKAQDNQDKKVMNSSLAQNSSFISKFSSIGLNAVGNVSDSKPGFPKSPLSAEKTKSPVFGQYTADPPLLRGQTGTPLFGQQTETPLFGQQANSLFGKQTETPLFGQQANSLFGKQTEAPVFGQQTISLFGKPSETPLFELQTKPSLFKEEAPTPLFAKGAVFEEETKFPLVGKETTPLFRQQIKTDKIEFGKSQSSSNSFGSHGSVCPKFDNTSIMHYDGIGSFFRFQLTGGTDTMMWNGKACNIRTRHHSITAMKCYETWSFEELRIVDYRCNRKGPFSQHDCFSNCCIKANSGFATNKDKKEEF